MSIQDIKAFISVSDNLSLGGQPTEIQLNELGKAGFKAVVNLGLLHQSYSLADEDGTVQSLGMEYRHIPVDFKSPGIRSLRDFFTTMDEYNDRKVFVHCAANYRVTCFVSLYLRSRQKWSTSQAHDLISRVWEPDEIWQEFMRYASSVFHLDQTQTMGSGGPMAEGVSRAR